MRSSPKSSAGFNTAENLRFCVLHLRRSLVRLIKRLLYPEFRTGQVLGTVLVFRIGRLGDFLNAIPALALLRSRLPQARIILATTVSSLPLVQSITSSYADPDALPWLEFVTPSLVDRAVCFTMAGPDRGLATMRRTIREEHPEAIFLLPYIGESLGGRLKKLLFFRLAGFRGPIFGFDGFTSRSHFRRTQYQLGMYEHAVFGPVRAISECAAIGVVEESEIVLQVSIPAAAMSWARKLLQASALMDTVLVAVSPGATFIHKAWPLDRYVQFCRRTHGTLRLPVAGGGHRCGPPVGRGAARRDRRPLPGHDRRNLGHAVGRAARALPAIRRQRRRSGPPGFRRRLPCGYHHQRA